MNIAFLGNFLAPYSSENDYRRTFEDLGWEVTPLQENMADGHEILKAALKADVFFWVHTHGWEPAGELTMFQILEKIHSHNIPTFSYHLDLWTGLPREQDLQNDAFWHVKYKFMVDGGMMRRHNHFWVPPGVAKDQCDKGDYLEEYDHDVVFVGSEGYHPEWPNRPILIAKLRERYKDRFALYGGENALRGEKLRHLYASAKVVVGDSLNLGYETPFYWSDRVTETLGRGGFLIHPYVKGMDNFFEDKKHLVYYRFGEFDDLFKKIDYYLLNERERYEIQDGGMECVKQLHTYHNRMRQIFSILAIHEPQLAKKI